MTCDAWIKKSTQALREAGIESAHLDSLIMLEDVLHTDRARLLAHPEQLITPPQLEQLSVMVTRRASREPIAYIRGYVEFYNRSFIVNKHVLVPRPESESFISVLLKKHTIEKSLLDIGTGSGVLGITAKLEIPQLMVTLSDIDPTTLTVASKNARKLSASVETTQADLLEAFNKNNIIFANLPYVPTSSEFTTSPNELDHEPSIALFSGSDGLDHYRRLWQQLTEMKDRPRFVYTESLKVQHEQLILLACAAGYKLDTTEGLVQIFTDQ